jgi:peptide/nickel transport system substrate-binding protein
MSTALTEPTDAGADERRPIKGGTVTWACRPGFPPSAIFPFTPPERFGLRNPYEFQMLMYRPLYWLGKDGKPGIDYDLSLAEPPQFSDDGWTVTVTLKPWKWSNGETICADNVMFWVNMLAVKGPRYGAYAPGYFPDNLTSYEKVAEDKVCFTFDRAYSKTWVLMNQLTLITPMPKAWDRTAHDAPANASSDIADVPAVYDYLVEQNGAWTEEGNEARTGWPTSPVWRVVNGPWRLKSFSLDGTVILVPNEHYSGPNKPYLDEFRQLPTTSDDEEYSRLQAGPDGPDAIQVGYLPFGLGTEQMVAGTNPLAEHYRLVPQNSYCIRIMPINFDNPTVAGRMLKQTYVRQALQHCMDQDTAIREIFHGYGYRTNGPVPLEPSSDQVSPTQRDDPMPFDIERVRKMLQDNGWDVSTTPAMCVRPGTGAGCAGEGIAAGDTLSFSLRYVHGDDALRRLVQQFAADAAKAGIELRLEAVHGSTMAGQDHTAWGSDQPRRWNLHTWNGGWAYYGRPTGEMLFRTGASSNFGHYSDPKADELIDRTVLGDDLDALYEYQDYIAAQAPVVWTPGFPIRLLEVARNLHGVEPINPYGLINPENWYYVEEGSHVAGDR